MTQTLKNTDFNHIENLFGRVLDYQIEEFEATDKIQKYKKRKAWYKLNLQLRIECLKKGFDYDLLGVDTFFDEPQRKAKATGSDSVQTENLTCPVCDAELLKGKKYCSREHRIEFHNSNRKKQND